jgi:rubrerythrin
MNNLERRVAALEQAQAGGGVCRECGGPGGRRLEYGIAYDESACIGTRDYADREPERCPTCGRSGPVINVVREQVRREE